METDLYDREAAKTAIYPRIRILVGDSDDVSQAVEAPWLYPTLLLFGECGEFANQLQKAVRDDGGRLTVSRVESLRAELGDIGWAFSRAATSLASSMGDVLTANLAKLASRAVRGVLSGSGDHR